MSGRSRAYALRYLQGFTHGGQRGAVHRLAVYTQGGASAGLAVMSLFAAAIAAAAVTYWVKVRNAALAQAAGIGRRLVPPPGAVIFRGVDTG